MSTTIYAPETLAALIEYSIRMRGVHRQIIFFAWRRAILQLGGDRFYWPSYTQASVFDYLDSGGVTYLPGHSRIVSKGFPYRDIACSPLPVIKRERSKRKRLRKAQKFPQPVTGWDVLQELEEEVVEAAEENTASGGKVDADTDATPATTITEDSRLHPQLPQPAADREAPQELSPRLHLQSGGSYTPQLPVALSEDSEYVVKLVENTLTFLRLLCKAKTSEDYFLAVAVFAQCRSDKSITSFLMARWNDLVGMSLQTDDNFLGNVRALKDILSKYDSVKKLPIFTKIYRFLLYCVGTSLFEKMGVKFDAKRFLHIEESLIKKEFHLGPDFVHCMLDTIVYITEVGYQCMTTGSIDPFFHHESTYEKWIQDGELLREQANYISNPEPHGFTVFDFLSRLDDNIEKGQSIAKFIGKSDSAAPLIRRLLADLSAIRASCLTKRLAQQERKAPFSILIHGGSSVGKSSFTKMVYYHYGKMMGLPIADEYKYTRNAFDQYWTNFNSSQWCVQLDDIAYLHPDKASECDPSLVEMLQVINNVPYVPTQADLADKGKTPVRARLVIATTNTENLNAEAYFACPLAVQRRLPYVVSLEPKPEYCKDNGPMLDPLKIPPSEPGDYPNIWRITVKKVVSASAVGLVKRHMGQCATTLEIAKYENIHDFIEWFSGMAREADGVQDQAMKCDSDMSAVALCKHDRVLARCAACSSEVALQNGGEIALTPWQTRFYQNREAEMEDEEPAPGEAFTITYIAACISRMSIIHRLIAIWYFLVISMVERFPRVGPLILGFVYGRWYFFIIAARIAHIPELRHLALLILGHRAYRAIRTPRAVLFASSIVAAVTLLKAYRLMMWYTAEPEKEIQSDIREQGEAPEPHQDRHENVWYKDQFECTPFDVPASSASRRSWSPDDLANYVSRNCASFAARVRTHDGIIHEKLGKAVCIGGNVYMVNNHCIPWETFELSLRFQSTKDGVNTNCDSLVTSSQILRYPERDLAFIQISGIPPKKDIRDMFAKESFEARFDAEYLRRLSDGSFDRKRVRAPELRRTYEFKDIDRDVHIRTAVWSAKVDTLTVNGDCGSLLASTTPLGPVLMGIHVLGSTDLTCIAISVTQEFLQSIPLTIFGATAPTLQVGGYSQALVNLNKKATIRFVESGTAAVLGSIAGFRGKMKSRVKPTLMHSVALRDGYVATTGPPVMNSWVPWRNALVDMVKPVTHMDQTLLQHCVECFTSEILAGLSKEDLASIKVYDINTAVNGCPGLAYVDKVPRNTSAGFPFRKSKKYFLEAVEPFGPYTHPVKVTPEIEAEMQKIVDTYEKGELYHPVFTASLKDEPVSFKKIKEGKTRVFCGAPLPWSLVGRMYYLSLIRVIQKNRFLFEAGPGTVAQSVEWEEIYQYIVCFGEDRIVAGDYVKFDKSMPPCVVLAAFQILINLMRAAGWTDIQIRISLGVAHDTAYPFVDFHGDLLLFFGTNPSGHILTVIINCLGNSLYCRYSYAMNHPDRTCSTFREHVRLFTYGDDLIMGVSKECTWFDHTVMQNELARIGIGFTMADKEAESVPFINIADATFLKRSWRFDPDIGHYVCPLEHDSINKMLTMCVESRTVGPELHALAVMETALREYFWYGRDEFNFRRRMFLGWVDELELAPYMGREFPTWDTLVAEFVQNSAARKRGGATPDPKSHTPDCMVAENSSCETGCADPESDLREDITSPGAGLASPHLEVIAFEQTNDARSGACQSCAIVLQQLQRVVSSEPQPQQCAECALHRASTSTSWALQSDENVIGDATEPSVTTSTSTVEFLDETPGSSWHVDSPALSNLADRQPQVELAQFLGRPVLIQTHVWSQSDTALTTTPWNPWHLFFNSAPIKNKISNYTFVNCKLKLKFVINASPFYSGAMAFTYCPLQTLTGNSIISDVGGGHLMLYSQRPKVWIFPQTCQGGEMTLPFLYHKNWLDLTVAYDVQAMGTITPCMFAPLVSCNGTTGQSVVVNVYAWAEDVKLHAPTTKLALQSDEFDYKPSQIASSVASASALLSRIPIIGPYMKATSVVSSSIASVASSFGYTNVPNMDTVDYVKNTVFPHNASCEVSVPTDRSAVDPKNEVTIDPRTVGLDGTDELSISNIVCRETWLGNAILSTTDAVDALTLVSRVTPSLIYSAGANLPYQMTPMGYLSSQFRYWRGDIIFRFKFICTRFHKGRVRITFDPMNDISTTVPDYTTVFNEVVDIGAEQDVEIRVPYSQALTYLRTSFTTGNYNLSGSPVSPNTVIGNGLVTMRVVNPLSAPTATAAIPVMVFVRAAENFEFAAPHNIFGGVQTASPLTLQSAEITYPIAPKQVVVGNAVTTADPNRHHVHFGEAVVSLRPLIHRLAHQYTMRIAVGGAYDVAIISSFQTRRLKYPGFSTQGPWSAFKVIGTGSSSYSYVRCGIHQIVSLMFVGERGSITHSINLESAILGKPANMQFKRQAATISSGAYGQLTWFSTTSTAASVARAFAASMPDPGSGVALTDASQQPGLVMNFPYYSPYNFQLVAPAAALTGQAEDQSNEDVVQFQAAYENTASSSSCRVNVWSAYGPDYNFFFFKNVPSLYVYNQPTAV